MMKSSFLFCGVSNLLSKELVCSLVDHLGVMNVGRLQTSPLPISHRRLVATPSPF